MPSDQEMSMITATRSSQKWSEHSLFWGSIETKKEGSELSTGSGNSRENYLAVLPRFLCDSSFEFLTQKTHRWNFLSHKSNKALANPPKCVPK